MAEVIALLAEEVDRLRSMIAPPASGPALPEALGDEDGEHWWMQGHVAPATAVLAVVFEQMLNVDEYAAMEVLVGGPDRSPRGARPGWSPADQQDNADRLVRRVKHIWVKDDPDNDERWLPAEPGEDGAEPWTEVSL